MSKEDRIEMTGVVTKVERDAFRVTLDDATTDEDENPNGILSTLSGKLRKNRIRVILGDKVRVSMSPYDMTRAQIVFRFTK